MQLKDPRQRYPLSLSEGHFPPLNHVKTLSPELLLFTCVPGHAYPTPHISHALEWGSQKAFGMSHAECLGIPTSRLWVSPCTAAVLSFLTKLSEPWNQVSFSAPVPKWGRAPPGDKYCWQKSWHLWMRTYNLESFLKLEILMVAQR